VRNDDEVAVLAGCERYGDGRRDAALGAASVEHLTHGANVNRVALEYFDECVFERIGSFRVQQLE
jgi:hypothetical protein